MTHFCVCASQGFLYENAPMWLFAFGLLEWKMTGETYGYLPIIHL